MAGVWDALGQGISRGLDRYLEQQRLAAAKQKEQETLDLQRQQLSLEQSSQRQAMEMADEARSAAEQEKRQASYKKMSDFSDPAKGIFVYEYDELSPGAYVPVPRDEQLRRYQQQYATWQAEQERLSGVEFGREKQLAQIRAAGGGGTPPKPAVDDQTLLQQLYDPKTGTLNTPIATALLTRRLGASLPEGVPFDPYSFVQGAAGLDRVKGAAQFLATAAGSLYPGKNVYADLVSLLSQWNPDLARLTAPPPPPPPPKVRPEPKPQWSGEAPAATDVQLQPGMQLLEQSPSGKALKVKDAKGRTMVWDDLSGTWLWE